MSHRFLVPRYASRAAAIIAVSEVTRQHVMQYLHVPPERVVTVYSGVDDVFRRPFDAARLDGDPPEVRAARALRALRRRDLPPEELHPPHPRVRARRPRARRPARGGRRGEPLPLRARAAGAGGARHLGLGAPPGLGRAGRARRECMRWPTPCCCRRCSSRADCRCSRRWRREPRSSPRTGTAPRSWPRAPRCWSIPSRWTTSRTASGACWTTRRCARG